MEKNGEGAFYIPSLFFAVTLLKAGHFVMVNSW